MKKVCFCEVCEKDFHLNIFFLWFLVVMKRHELEINKEIERWEDLARFCQEIFEDFVKFNTNLSLDSFVKCNPWFRAKSIL